MGALFPQPASIKPCVSVSPFPRLCFLRWRVRARAHDLVSHRQDEGDGAPYMPDAAKYRGVLGEATVARWETLVSPVAIDAPVATGAFPVLLFSHGWGGRAASSSVWLSEVASHGFVVVGVDHPFMGIVVTSAPSASPNRGDQFPSGRYADLYYADDLAFVARSLATLNISDPVLKGAIQSSSVFAAGHSSGHAAATAFAALHGGVKALISFDAGVSQWARERGIEIRARNIVRLGARATNHRADVRPADLGLRARRHSRQYRRF